MKTNFQNFKYAALTAIVLVLNVSCEREESALNFGELAVHLEEVSEIVMVDRLADEVDNMIENVYYTDEQEALAGKQGTALKSVETPYFLSECVVITTVVTEFTIEKTLDFGTGCETTNGNILSGILQLSYQKDMEANVNTIYTSFENFYFNGARISGERVVVRTRANENENPQADIAYTIDITWGNGLVTKHEGTKVREWIEGVNNGVWGDNVYLITGNWTTTFSNGSIHQGTIVTPLRRELSCVFLVSGVLHLQRNTMGGMLDYGDGNCDSQAVFTYDNGNIKTIGLH